MRPHLLFTVQAPLGAWGAASSSSAAQARKSTELEPSRSALVGMLATALGWRRERLAEVDAAVRIALRVDAAPEHETLPDFQTATPAEAPSGVYRWTRFSELRGHLAGTATTGSIRSWREFWTDGCWTVALVATGAGPPTLDELRDALRAPRWPLCAGRKAFALGLPPDPEIVEATDLEAAFAAYGPPWRRHAALRRWLRRSGLKDGQDATDRILFDVDMPGAPPPERRVLRRDRPDPAILSDGLAGPWTRPRWHERAVGEAWIPRGEGAP